MIKNRSTVSRGRPAILAQWTRNIRVGSDVNAPAPVHHLQQDLETLAQTPEQPQQEPETEWKPLFNSQDFLRGKDELSLDSYRLPSPYLARIGKEVTLMRERLCRLASNHKITNPDAGKEVLHQI